MQSEKKSAQGINVAVLSPKETKMFTDLPGNQESCGHQNPN